MSKNLCGKTRPINKPYEVYRSASMWGWEWRVLKKYQSPENEATNPYARWFCAVKSPFTHGGYDLGDTYVKDILGAGAYQVDDLSEIEEW